MSDRPLYADTHSDGVGGPRHPHPASPVLDLARLAPSAVFLLVLGGVNPVVLPVAAVIVVVVLAFRYVAWTRFTYGVEGAHLVVESGVGMNWDEAH